MIPRLQAILDVDAAAAAGWTPADLAHAFLDGGARVIQIRAKRLASAPFLDLCDAVVELAAGCSASVIVNDRVDLAMLSRAAGVHVGQDDLPPQAARTLLGADAVVGWSTHDVEQIERARLEPVTYVAVGPIYGTRTKDTGYSPVGPALVREAVKRLPGRPIVAIGGITLETAPLLWEAGAAAVAVIGDLLSGGNPAARVASYNRLAYAAQPGSGQTP